MYLKIIINNLTIKIKAKSSLLKSENVADENQPKQQAEVQNSW